MATPNEVQAQANDTSKNSMIEKTVTDYDSTKHTFEHHSAKSIFKKNFEDDQQSSFNE